MISVSCKQVRQRGSSPISLHGVDAFFLLSYDNPKCPEDILQSAQQNLELRSQTKEGEYSRISPTHTHTTLYSNGTLQELIDSYLNGERTLSNDRLSYLILSSSSSSNDDDSAHTDFDLLICAAHWIGDGMALHTFANELFHLLGHHASDESALMVLLEQEFKHRYSDHTRQVSLLHFSSIKKKPFLKRFFFSGCFASAVFGRSTTLSSFEQTLQGSVQD